eukprot:TRINITY_DN952_c0_g1_i4.p1 TRINITY_DN952_c0_g1~~TRINITY_DN952_c0_g1_i4.p1  ORF type:complete len:264 (+),score=41.80 TRINITY_DN952_c0_g1_i4:751-1542(+)
MQEACRLLEGRHDFSSFRAAGCQAASALKTLKELTVTEMSGGNWAVFPDAHMRLEARRTDKQTLGQIHHPFDHVNDATLDASTTSTKGVDGEDAVIQCGRRDSNTAHLDSQGSNIETDPTDRGERPAGAPAVLGRKDNEEQQQEELREASDRGEERERGSTPGWWTGRPSSEQERFQCFIVTARAQSFLYHQVRLMVGFIKAIGSGQISLDDGRRIMEARTVTASPAMAPADGLYLAAVDYGDFSRRSKPTMGMPSSPSSSQE